MTRTEAIDRGLFVGESWKPDEGFVCRQCRSFARMHPQTNHIWGCLECKFTTASVYFSFASIEEMRCHDKERSHRQPRPLFRCPA